jgi:hypothetical protein
MSTLNYKYKPYSYAFDKAIHNLSAQTDEQLKTLSNIVIGEAKIMVNDEKTMVYDAKRFKNINTQMNFFVSNATKLLNAAILINNNIVERGLRPLTYNDFIEAIYDLCIICKINPKMYGLNDRPTNDIRKAAQNARNTARKAAQNANPAQPESPYANVPPPKGGKRRTKHRKTKSRKHRATKSRKLRR